MIRFSSDTVVNLSGMVAFNKFADFHKKGKTVVVFYYDKGTDYSYEVTDKEAALFFDRLSRCPGWVVVSDWAFNPAATRSISIEGAYLGITMPSGLLRTYPLADADECKTVFDRICRLADGE